MSELHRVGDIDIAQDLDFQRREWTFQRIGWLVLSAITLFALVGGCGRGFLARATTQSAGRELVLRYDRLARHQAATKLEIDLAAKGGDTVAIWLDEQYIHGLEIRSISPEPERMVPGNGRITYHFVVETDPRITFLITPDKFWRRTGRLGIQDGPSVRFRQFVFP